MNTEEAGMVNAYVCPDGHTTWTRNGDDGTTPHVMPCPETGCDKEATSQFYKVPQETPATHEWYRPQFPANLDGPARSYAEQGGLMLRRTVPLPWTQPTNPTEARLAPDGRVAFRIHIAISVWDNESEQRWYAVDTPNGQFTVTLLTDEEVAEWAPLEMR
ncbi:hypothetical protein [Lentzea cavernae]|uniref:Uncharacterized protein n=1 Tax=Lentzea cavernae TaxID=2020703 RepID=A0ABQ3MSQ9_9PSEU|nr:hypothetical protein [Lentzea cavernae]GHH57788.1 hypothetical protein GCM10017774_78070 [Lentzea cavernae]